jgi:hypothetical protein
MYCICCKKDKVIPYDGSYKLGKDPHHSEVTEEDLLWKNEETKDGRFKTIDHEMVSDGIIQIIDAGYGSKSDGDQFIIAICDDCIKENLEDGTLLYFSNYMSSYFTKVNIEKSKKAYRRRKNLDKLV